jgi:hypothetical protein
MQDDQIGPKIIGLAPADMARLPPSISPTNMFLVVYNLVCQWDYTYFELALLYKGNCPFLLYLLLPVLRFLWSDHIGRIFASRDKDRV